MCHNPLGARSAESGTVGQVLQEKNGDPKVIYNIQMNLRRAWSLLLKETGCPKQQMQQRVQTLWITISC
jgi:hypothetical protein